ncbi:hypothetical protein TWF506_009010 [Arthrobotrys conoides]|uniref:Uncharacterized protein n=1 Tax=Arthrobotrys conoides TaxID=74498 RepID=A0AAN8PDZ0_9PEZI
MIEAFKKEIKMIEGAKKEVKMIEGAKKEVKAIEGAGKEVQKEVKQPQGITGLIRREIKKTSRKKRQEVKIQTMRAQEAEDPDVERFGYGGWAGEFMDKLRRSRKSSGSSKS